MYCRFNAAYIGHVTLLRFIVLALHRSSHKQRPPRSSVTAYRPHIGGDFCFRRTPRVFHLYRPGQVQTLYAAYGIHCGYQRSLAEAIASQPGLNTRMLVKPCETRYAYTLSLELQRALLQ